MSVSDNEARYFAQQDAHTRARFREALQARAEAAQAHREAAEAAGTADHAIGQRLHDLGFEGEAAAALHLMPLVKVAWADGGVSGAERRAVMAAAAVQGFDPGHPAALMLASVLEQQPSSEWLDESMAALRDILAQQPQPPADLLEACARIADASGGLLGFGGRISDDERLALREIESLFDEAVRRHTLTDLC